MSTYEQVWDYLDYIRQLTSDDDTIPAEFHNKLVELQSLLPVYRISTYDCPSDPASVTDVSHTANIEISPPAEDTSPKFDTPSQETINPSAVDAEGLRVAFPNGAFTGYEDNDSSTAPTRGSDSEVQKASQALSRCLKGIQRHRDKFGKFLSNFDFASHWESQKTNDQNKTVSLICQVFKDDYERSALAAVCCYAASLEYLKYANYQQEQGLFKRGTLKEFVALILRQDGGKEGNNEKLERGIRLGDNLRSLRFQFGDMALLTAQQYTSLSQVGQNDLHKIGQILRGWQETYSFTLPLTFDEAVLQARRAMGSGSMKQQHHSTPAMDASSMSVFRLDTTGATYGNNEMVATLNTNHLTHPSTATDSLSHLIALFQAFGGSIPVFVFDQVSLKQKRWDSSGCVTDIEPLEADIDPIFLQYARNPDQFRALAGQVATIQGSDVYSAYVLDDKYRLGSSDTFTIDGAETVVLRVIGYVFPRDLYRSLIPDFPGLIRLLLDILCNVLHKIPESSTAAVLFPEIREALLEALLVACSLGGEIRTLALKAAEKVADKGLSRYLYISLAYHKSVSLRLLGSLEGSAQVIHEICCSCSHLTDVCGTQFYQKLDSLPHTRRDRAELGRLHRSRLENLVQTGRIERAAAEVNDWLPLRSSNAYYLQDIVVIERIGTIAGIFRVNGVPENTQEQLLSEIRKRILFGSMTAVVGNHASIPESVNVPALSYNTRPRSPDSVRIHNTDVGRSDRQPQNELQQNEERRNVLSQFFQAKKPSFLVVDNLLINCASRADTCSLFSKKPEISHSLHPPETLHISECLLRDINVYFREACRNMSLDEYGTLIDSCGVERRNDLCDNFDSTCFTATMLASNSPLQFRQMIFSAFALIEEILRAEHPRTLACFFEVLLHFIQIGLRDLACRLLDYIQRMSEVVLTNTNRLRMMFQLLKDIKEDCLEEALAQFWKCMVDTIEGTLPKSGGLVVAIRLDYIKRVHGTSDYTKEERLLRTLFAGLDAGLTIKTPRVMLNLAHNLNKQGRHNEAETIAHEVRSLLQSNSMYAGKITERIECEKIVAHSQFSLGKISKAEQTLRAAIEMIKDQLGPRHAWVVEFMAVLQYWLRIWGQERSANGVHKDIEERLGPE